MNERKYATPTQDYVLVEFERTFEDRVKSLDLIINTDYAPTEHKNIRGKVLGVPQFLSDLTLRIKSPGYPTPKRQVTSDWIEEMNRYGPRYDRSWYSLAGYVPEYEYLRDIEPVVQVGDVIYVDYTCLLAKNIVEDTPARKVYKVRYDNIICVERGIKPVFGGEFIDVVPNLIMVGGYTLAIPDMESWEDITVPVANENGEIIGLLTAPAPRPKWLRAELCYVNPDNVRRLKPGDVLYYVPNADWTVKIGGKEYFAIPERDYLAISINNYMKPLGDRVILKRKPADEKSAGGIIIPDTAREQTTEGTIIDAGPDVKNKALTSGAKVLFAKGAGTLIQVDGEEQVIMRESDIYLLL